MSGEVLVAIPVYNERSHVRSVVEKVREHVSEVLVVDDGSTDGTHEIMAELCGIRRVSHDRNLGYGRALVSAFQYAAEHAFPWLITIDCDQQHEPESIPDFLEAIRRDDADILSGSRFLGHSEALGAAPFERRRINELITLELNQQLGLTLTDAFCGFKAYRTAALADLSIDVFGYAMPLQLWAQAVASSLRIREIPVRLIYNDPDRSFGNGLDDPDRRLQHYLSVLGAEVDKIQPQPPGLGQVRASARVSVGQASSAAPACDAERRGYDRNGALGSTVCP